jgi:hypothetical protein
VIFDRRSTGDASVDLVTALPRTPATTHLRGSMGDGADGQSVRRLAVLSRKPPPRGAVLLAEVDGRPVAAIGIFDGRTVADPARSTFALRGRLRLERLFLRAVIAAGGV